MIKQIKPHWSEAIKKAFQKSFAQSAVKAALKIIHLAFRINAIFSGPKCKSIMFGELTKCSAL
jgi:hypothetical protein